ncbi:MAG TPA: nuclear transport factor 2 family protein [Anaeromyxobacteraceae bacterium]|nr:nuclear transport factor 2 family protein [Anaeromyxobacteraceae bacterium]
MSLRALAPAALLLAACAAHRIPGTNIADTEDNRAVMAVVQAYTEALQRRDAAALLALASPEYFDNGGTADPADDLDFARLEQTLPADLARLESLRVEIQVRNVQIDKDTAVVELWSDGWYRIQTPQGVVPRRDQDLHRMRLVQRDGAWKIVSGM